MCTYVRVLVIAVGFIKSSLVESDSLATAQFTLLWFLSLHKHIDRKILTCYLTASMINKSCSVECDTLATAKFTLFWFLSLYTYMYTDLLPDSVNDKKELFGGV